MTKLNPVLSRSHLPGPHPFWHHEPSLSQREITGGMGHRNAPLLHREHYTVDTDLAVTVPATFYLDIGQIPGTDASVPSSKFCYHNNLSNGYAIKWVSIC